jgi:hypothetical protein
MRFSLRRLLAVVAFVAVGCAGLAGHSRFWADAVAGITIILYAWMIVRAIGSDGRIRVVSQTIAVIGLGYLALAIASMVTVAPDILFTNLLLATWEKYTLPYMKDHSLDAIAEMSSRQALEREYGSIFIIGHCMLSWALSALSGALAGRLYDRRDSSRKA